MRCLSLSRRNLRASLEAPPDLARVMQLDTKVVRELPHKPGVLLEHAPDEYDIGLSL